MADLGRFTTLDPMADFYPGVTPYNYAINNPVTYIDVYGLGPIDWIKKLFGKRDPCPLNQHKQKTSPRIRAPKQKTKKPTKPTNSAKNSGNTNTLPLTMPEPYIPNVDLNIAYIPSILPMQDDKEFPSPGGGSGDRLIRTGKQDPFKGNVFIENSWNLRENNEEWEAFIVPIVNYLKKHRKIKIEIGLSTNITMLDKNGNENRVKHLNLPPDIVVNRRAYFLQQHIKNTYGIPEHRIIFGPAHNKTGQTGMTVEINIIRE